MLLFRHFRAAARRRLFRLRRAMLSMRRHIICRKAVTPWLAGLRITVNIRCRVTLLMFFSCHAAAADTCHAAAAFK